MEGTKITLDGVLHHLLRMHGEQQLTSLAVMESLDRNTDAQKRRAYQEVSLAARVSLPYDTRRAWDCLTTMAEADDVAAYLTMFECRP